MRLGPASEIAVRYLALASVFFLSGCKPSSDTQEPLANSTSGTQAVGSSSAGPASGTVSGEVFIVTNGRENIRLGLVHVSFVREETLESYKTSFKDKEASALNELRATFSAQKPGYETALSKFMSLLPTYQEAEHDLSESLSAPCVTIDGETISGVNPFKAATIILQDKKRSKLGSVLLPAYQAAKDREEGLTTIIQQEQSLLSSEPADFLSSFPEEGSTKTDADGKFSFTLPAGHSYTLLAMADRMVTDHVEHYCWLESIVVPSSGTTPDIILSNDNVVDALPADCAVADDSISPQPQPVPEIEIAASPTDYTFKDESGNPIDPAVPEASAGPRDTEDLNASDWLAPYPYPAKLNWSWTLTTTGKTYDNVVITDITDKTVTITHSLGVAHIGVDELPTDIQHALNYTPHANVRQTNATP